MFPGSDVLVAPQYANIACSICIPFTPEVRPQSFHLAEMVNRTGGALGGEVNNRPASGKPLDLSSYFAMPEWAFLVHLILYNIDGVQRQAELKKAASASLWNTGTDAYETKQREIRIMIQAHVLHNYPLIEIVEHHLEER